MESLEYQLFKHNRDSVIREQTKTRQVEYDEAYNKGLWNSVKWRNPLAYFILKR